MKNPDVPPGETILAVDIGTSGCRATVFGAEGAVVASFEQTYPYVTSSAAGFAEQNPEQIFDVFVEVVSRVCAGCPERVSYVVLDSVLRSLVLLDGDGMPLAPLSIWADTRATEQCRSLDERFTVAGWHRKTGCPLSPSSPLARLLWYKEHQPGIYASFSKAVSIKSYILHRLFDVYVEDHGVASASGLFNQGTLSWDDDILAHLGIHAERLPRPVPVEHRLESRSTGAAPASGFPLGATWVIGGGDGPMAHLGTAGYRSDIASLTIGTSSAVRMLGAGSLQGGNPEEWTYILDSHHLISGVASTVGGNVLEWCLHTLVPWDGNWNALDEQLMACSGDGDLLFFPGLSQGFQNGAVAKADFSQPIRGYAAGTVIRSVIEGIVFHTALLLRRFAAGRSLSAIALSGSLTRFHLVREMIAGLFAAPEVYVTDCCAPHLGSLRLLNGPCQPGQKWHQHGTGHGYVDKYSFWCNSLLTAKHGQENVLTFGAV